MTASGIDFYRQDLEIDIISRLAEVKSIDLDKATDVYFKSRLSQAVSQGRYGIDNLDSKYLVEDLIENEPELF